VARRYGVKADTIQGWVRQGKFPQPLRLGRKCSRWSIRDLKRWEDEKRQEQAPRSEWLDRQRRQHLREVKAAKE
jgi:predicted DNA-binding transcriptional regulator AlpA